MEETNDSMLCPICQKADLVFKVQTIYTESLNIFNKKQPHPAIETMLAHAREIKPIPNPESNDFTRAFAAPTGRNDLIRYMHPDLLAAILAAALIYMAYLTSSQQNLAPYIFGGILVLGLIPYLIKRKNVMVWYQNSKKEVEQPPVSAYQALQHWMKLYYCARDGIVFERDREGQIPLNEMKSYLMRE